MNILGIGGWEFVAILLIALVVAGPKRMIRWSYILGVYVGKLRMMWAETMSIIQKEFDEAGVDIKLPKEPPTRQSINQMAEKALKPFTSQIQEAMDEVEAEARKLDEVAAAASGNGAGSKDNGKPQTKDADAGFGTWSSAGKKDS